MAITSANNSKIPIQLKSAQFRYALTYVIITLCVLLFLNLYIAERSQEIFYSSKKASMLEKCEIASTALSDLPVLNYSAIENALADIVTTSASRLTVTDQNGRIIYDNTILYSEKGQYALFPEIVQALKGNDVFTWKYNNNAMWSHTAVPIYSYGILVGCVYIMEYDAEEGVLITSLQNTIFTLTVILVSAVILFSILFATAYTKRLRKIMASIRTVRTGDYTHKLDIGGNDELTVLGSEFNDLISRLQISENKRRQFVSDASHELRTPLASIKLLTDSILQNEMDPQTVKEFVEDIGKEAERLNRMSHKLLTLTRTEVQPESDLETIYIEPTVRRVTKMLSAFAERSQVSLLCHIRKDSPILIPEDDLYQIIFNLAENGIKYNHQGGSLQITVDSDCENAIVSIQDSGMGIPEESIAHIFERFYRVDKARSRATGGSGLGLSIVKNMVEKNNGTINVESVLQQGSCFTVTFPIFDLEESV